MSIAVALAGRRVRALATLLVLAASAAITSSAAAAAEAPATLRVGTQTLTRCARTPLGYCGKLSVPLDYSSPAGPFITIAFRWYPAQDGDARGTVVPVEGGPGYPSIGSVSYPSGGQPSGYAAMYGPVLERFNMLAVDNRGTGVSTPLRCSSLQDFSGPTGTSAFQQVVGECAARLNHRWRFPGGGYVHASDLFTSALAAADLASVIKALEVGRVDLYGDSYGSFFAQVFANRFPHMLRSLILDSTYETVGLDPWYRSSVESMPADFQDACSRAPACAGAEAGSVWATLGKLAATLRLEPISGVVPGPTGALEHVSMGVVGLVDLVNDAAEDTQMYRDLDAAARALLTEADPSPLLRLYAQRLAVDEAYFDLPVSEYSVELYFAVGCLDYPQLFDMSAQPATREEQLAAAEAALPASTFSPFSTAEWLAQDENTEAYTGCVDWPAPTIATPPVTGETPLLGRESKLPVLVLGGELDSWTPPVEAPKVMALVGGDARFVELANSTHVVGEGDTVCGSALIRAFVERPQDLQTMDVSCAAAVPAIHAVGVYPLTLAAEQTIDPAPGSDASQADLQLAAAAVQTAGDAIARYEATEVTRDHGLHAGTVVASHGGSLLTLTNDQLVPGVAVSGTVSLAASPIPEDGQTATATLTVSAAGLRPASLTATWTTAGSAALAQVTGEVAGVTVSGTTPAP
jgi:pimeloyl-ACP methyl ester carboxylesterase